jgi:hypothetical protein
MVLNLNMLKSGSQAPGAPGAPPSESFDLLSSNFGYNDLTANLSLNANNNNNPF